MSESNLNEKQFEVKCLNCNEINIVTKEDMENQETIWKDCKCCGCELEIEIEYDKNDEPINVYVY